MRHPSGQEKAAKSKRFCVRSMAVRKAGEVEDRHLYWYSASVRKAASTDDSSGSSEGLSVVQSTFRRRQILGPIEQPVDRMQQQFHVAVGVGLLDPAPAGGRGEHPEHRGRGVQSRIGGLIRVVGNHAVAAAAGRPEGIPLPPRQPLDQHRQRAGVDVHRPARLHQRHVAQAHLAGTNRGTWLEEEVDGQHPAQVGMAFHGPMGIGQCQRNLDRDGSLGGGQLEPIGRTLALGIAIILDLHRTTQRGMGPVLQADMKPLVACQIARLVILPRGAEPRGETLQIAMFGRRDLPQLDAQHAPSALRVSRQKADALRAARPPCSPPSIQEFASLAIEERNDRQIVGDRPRWSTSQRQPCGCAKPDPGGSEKNSVGTQQNPAFDPILWFRSRKTSMFGKKRPPTFGCAIDVQNSPKRPLLRKDQPGARASIPRTLTAQEKTVLTYRQYTIKRILRQLQRTNGLSVEI